MSSLEPRDSLDHSTMSGGLEHQRKWSSPSLGHAVAWICALAGLAIGSRPISDNSFLTHLATGDLIRKTGSIPRVDPYSFSAPGGEWTVQSWLPSLTYSWLNELGGGTGLRLFNGAAVALIVVMLWQLSAPARPLVARLIVMLPAVVIGSSQWTPRPLLVGLVCFLFVLQVLQDQRMPYWLVPIMWIWVNSHGSFPLGFVLIGCFGVGHILDQRLVADGSWRLPRKEMRVFGWAVAGGLVSMANPLGPRLLIFPVQLLSRREALSGVSEWLAPDFDSIPELVFLAVLVAFVVVARSGAKWRLLLPGIVFAVSGLLAMRNVGVASMVLLVVMAPSCQFRGSLRGHEQGVTPRVLVGLAVLGFLVSPALLSQSESVSFEAYPVAEIDWLEEQGLVADDASNLIHRDFVGNYLHHRFGAEAAVFVDDRFDYFPQQILSDHAGLIVGGDYGAILRRHDARTVLWTRTGGFAAWLYASSDWVVVYESDEWLIAQPATT